MLIAGLLILCLIFLAAAALLALVSGGYLPLWIDVDQVLDPYALSTALSPISTILSLLAVAAFLAALFAMGRHVNIFGTAGQGGVVPPNWRIVVSLFGFSFMLLAGTAVYIGITSNSRLAQPEIVITLILIMGVVALLSALGGLAALLRQRGDGTAGDPFHGEALALPKGSIRAVIALGLVLIFALVSVYLIGRAENTTQFVYGLTQEQADEIDANRIVSRYQTLVDPPRYDVVLSTEQPEFQRDLSQQLLTILGTLVTAVVAFYFGTEHLNRERVDPPDDGGAEASEEDPPAASTAPPIAKTRPVGS